MNPFAQCALPSAVPAATRTLALYGATVELWWLPGRAARRTAAPALLLQDRAPRILAEEALWQSQSPPAVLTKNRYPFARSAGILWSATPTREVTAELLALACALVDPAQGSALMNTVGAAATQPRAHIHLVGERLPFLLELPRTPLDPRTLGGEPWGDVEFVQLAAPFPGCVLGVCGSQAARAAAVARLLAARSCPAVNLVSAGDITWFAPRRSETPAPFFPRPLGCAELWGRFCYEDEAAFAAADATMLDAAFAAALEPSLP